MKEYTIRVDDDGVRSKHDALIRLAQRSRRASRMNRDDIEAEGPDDDVAQYLAYIVHEESGNKKGR
jgi:hypothetical protein